MKLPLRVLILFLIFAIVVFSALLFSVFDKKENSPREAVFKGEIFSLEIADTGEERERGLGYRESLCEHCGMLFIFEAPGKYPFWMKGMRFSLDIIWLRGNEVVFVARGVDPQSKDTLFPPEEADRVLEVNADKAGGIREGDTIEFR